MQIVTMGGHVCMDLTKSAVTLNRRMKRAIEKIWMLNLCKINTKRKLSIIKIDMLQAALYGCETAKLVMRSWVSLERR